MQVHGRCHCGQVTFTSEAKPEHTVVCHCRDCQIMSGGPYRSIVSSKESDFTLLSGELTLYYKTETAAIPESWRFVIAADPAHLCDL